MTKRLTDVLGAWSRTLGDEVSAAKGVAWPSIRSSAHVPGVVHQAVRTWGSKIFSSATTVEEARWLESHGVDAIIAQGLEAGGHRGIFLSEDLTSQVGTSRWCRRS